MPITPKKLIILDRDGVINHDSDAYIKNLDEFIFLPGSLAAIARLKQAGLRIAVATNQSGIARGYFTTAGLDAMHEKLREALAALGGGIDAIYYCPHGPDDHCDCRKPHPGLLRQALADFAISAAEALVVGDSVRDLEAGWALGIDGVLVRTGKGQRSLAKLRSDPRFVSVAVYDDLAAVAAAILESDPGTDKATRPSPSTLSPSKIMDK